MNGPSTNPENDLGSSLARQADEFARRGGHTLDLDQVVTRAGEIRRGRRMRATLAMAAVVLAVAVPVGVTVLGSDPTKPQQVLPADQPDTSPIGIEGLKDGAVPKNGYTTGDVIYDAEGNDIPIEDSSVRSIARLSDGYLVAEQTSDEDEVVRFVSLAKGTMLPRFGRGSGSFAVSANGNAGAFVSTDGLVQVFQDGGELFDLGTVPGQSFGVVGIDGEDCSPAGQCRVYVETKDEDPKLWSVSPSGDAVVVYPGLRGAVGVTAEGLVAGPVSVSDDGSCSEVRQADDAPLWKTCDFRFFSFSPNGTYLNGAGPYGSGLGDGQVSVLNAKSQQVELDLRTEEGVVVTSTLWEDDGHLLATVVRGTTWAVIRIALDGNREYALPPVETGDDVQPPFRLAVR